MNPLVGIRAKLDRGDEHVRTYERQERRTFARKKPPKVGISYQVDQQRSLLILIVARVPELPPRLGVLIGDAVHNYRSALDQLVFELAFMDSRGRELEKTGFPASDTRDNFEGKHVQTSLLAGLTQEHRAMFKRFQPYRGWNRPPGIHPIRLLHDLSNDDKHRLTQPTLICAQSMLLTFAFEEMQDCIVNHNIPETWNASILGLPLEADAKVCEIPLLMTGPNPQVEVNGSLQTFVGFRNGVGPVPVLRAIGEYAREAVEFFAPEFDRPIGLALRGRKRFGRISPPSTPSGTTTRSLGIVTDGGFVEMDDPAVLVAAQRESQAARLAE